MARPALCVALILTAAGSPAFAQARPDQVEIYSTPSAIEGPAADCRTEIDCQPDLAGAPAQSRPSKIWSVRSSQVAPDADVLPLYPIAIIADVDVEDSRRGGHDRDDDQDRDHRRDFPDLRRGD